MEKTKIIDQNIQRFKNIEFLRFLLASFILLFHLFNAKSYLFGYFPENSFYAFMKQHIGIVGDHCVDFFFVISGFFLIFGFKKEISLLDFFKKKIARLYPVLVLMLLFCIGLSLLKIIKMDFYSTILEMLFVSNIGLTLKHGNISGSWFVSALVFVSCFYFYLYKNFDKKISDLITFLITIFCYAYLIHWTGGRIAGHIVSNDYVFNSGLMRAFAGMGFGVMISNYYNSYVQNLSDCIQTFKTKIIWSILEISLFGYFINVMLFNKITFKNDIFLIIVFSFIFFLFLLEKGLVTKILDNNLSLFLGRYAFSLYMVHLPIIRLVNRYLWQNNLDFIKTHPIFQVVMVFCICFALAILIYHFVEKPCAKLLSKKLFPEKTKI